MSRLAALYPDQRVEEVGPEELTRSFEDLDFEEQEAATPFLRAADAALQPFRCAAEIKKFRPESVAALHTISEDAALRRSMERTRDVAGGIWGDVLGGLLDDDGPDTYARLCFNHNNPVVRRLAGARDRTLLRHAIRTLYVQALMLGREPLRAAELDALNQGLLGLVDLAAGAKGGAR
jgi:molecular chaperone HtpG